jgi:hypothetical protein
MTPNYEVTIVVKITLNENLVPSQSQWVKLNPLCDLTYNYFFARKLIRAAQFVFQIKQGAAVYSGYVNEHPIGPVSLHLSEKGVVVRTLLLSEIGFIGELFADVESLEEAVSQDVFEGLAGKSVLTLALH